MRIEARMERARVRWKWFTRVRERRWEGLGGCRERERVSWGGPRWWIGCERFPRWGLWWERSESLMRLAELVWVWLHRAPFGMLILGSAAWTECV